MSKTVLACLTTALWLGGLTDAYLKHLKACWQALANGPGTGLHVDDLDSTILLHILKCIR